MTKKELFDQWNTKTLGGTTKLTPENFDLIQDPVHVEAPNESSLELVNLVGQATNTQSQSGPISGGGKYVEVAVSGTGHILIFQPDPGQVFVLMAGQIANTGSESFSASLSLSGDPTGFSENVPIDNGISGTSNQVIDMLNSPVYCSNELALSAYFGTVGASGNEVKLVLHRVR